MADAFSSFSNYLPFAPPSPDAPAAPRPSPADIPASGTGNWFTAGIMSGFHGALSEGARALQAGAQLAGATDTAKSLSDFAEEAHAREQTYARPDLEAHPWSPSGIAYNISRMVPLGLAALGGGAVAGLALPEEAAVGGAAALGTAARAIPALVRGAGAATAMFPFTAGANVQRQISETGDLTEPGKALALGVPEAAVQGVLPGGLESFFGKGIMRGIAHSAAAQGVAGGATEAMTQLMGDPDRGFADRASAIVSQTLAGGGLGAIIGGAHGSFRALVGKPVQSISTEDLAKTTDQALLTYQPEATAMRGPLQDVPGGELAGRIDTLQREPTKTQASVEELRQLLQEQQRRETEAAATKAAEPPPQLLLPPPATREGPPLQEMPPAELATRLYGVQEHLKLNPEDPGAQRAFEVLGQEFSRRAEEADAARAAAEPPAGPQQLLPPPATREGPPLQAMPPAELWTRLSAVQQHLAVNPEDLGARRASEMLGQEFSRRVEEAKAVAEPAAPAAPATEVPLAAHEPAAPTVPAPGEPAPGEPAPGPGEPAPVVAPAAAAPVPVLDFTKGRIKEGTAQYAAASPEAQAEMRQPLIDAIIARGDKAPTALQKKWGKALDILTDKGELKDELIPEQPVETPPGVVPEVPPEAPVDPMAIPAFLRRAPPVARDAPIETADDRAAAFNGVKAQIASLPDSEIKNQHVAEAETVEKLLPNAENNPGLVGPLNAKISSLRAGVDAAVQRPADQVATPDLAPSPHAEAQQAMSGDLDVRLTGAQSALVGLRKALGDRPDAVAALDQHEEWLKTVRDAASPEELRKALAANPEADPDADNLSNLTQISKPMQKQISSYLARQQAVVQEMQYQSGSRARVVTSRDGLPVTQLDADVTDMHQRGVPLADVADHIIEHTADPEQAEIVAKLKDFLPKDAKTVFRDGVVDKEGEYFPKDKTSALYNAANATVTAVHEMVHAVMHRALDGASDAAEAIRGIYDQLKGKGDHAGLTNAHEMVSEALANPVYRAFLKSQFVRGTSLWDRFVNTARGIIGLEPRLYNAFDRIMSLGDDLMKEQQQYPNDAWVGPDSYARRADDGAGAAAAGADQGRETTFQRLKEGGKLNVLNAIRSAAFGWVDGYRLARLYGDVIPSMRPYVDTLSKVEAREGALLKASQVGYNMVRKLPTEGQELLHKVMSDATFYGLDPQKPAPLDIQDTPGRVKLHQELAANWNQLLNVKGGEAAYEALRAKASSDYHAVLTDRLQTLERTFPALGAPNVFDIFDRSTGIHTDPRKTEAFFKQAVADKVDGLTKYRDQLATNRATADAVIKAGGVSVDDLRELAKQGSVLTNVDLEKLKNVDPEKAAKLIEFMDKAGQTELGKQSSSLKADVGSINSVLKEVTGRRDAAAKAPYFHLGRDGNYFVTAKLATDSEGVVDPEKLAKFAEFLDGAGHKNVAVMQGGQHDTLYARVKNPSEMNALYKSVLEAQKQGFLSSEPKSVGAGEATTVFKSIAPDAMRKAVEALQRPDVPEGLSDAHAAKVNAAYSEQLADMQRTLLNMMAENSIGRVLARRANVQGFDKDMSESSQYASQVMSRSLAHMTTAPETGALIRNMSDQIRAVNHDDTIDSNTKLAASQAVGELMLRDRLRTAYVPPTMLDAIRHISHTIHVGSSPAYFLTLMSQLATTSLPELGKTHGYGAAAQAMFRTSPEALAVIKAITQSQDWGTAGITRDALEKAGIAPATVDEVMGAVSRGVMGTAMYSTQMTQNSPLARGPGGTVLKAANAMGLYAELFPRLVTLLSAGDLYDAKPYTDPRSGNLMTREQFVDRAINDSQGNWDASLNSRQTSKGGMFGATSPLINQFMGWQIRMTGKIYNEALDLFDARTRPEAMRWMLGHSAATAMFAGTLGMPLLSVAASVYDRLMDWVTNRDDHDLTASYRNFLSDTFGKDMGEIIARGLPRAVGMDFAHFGEATIVPGSSTINIAFEKRKLEDAQRDWFKSMGGAGVGDVFNVAAAVRDITNGDYLNGLIKMSPEILKAPAEAYRLGQRGFVNNLNGQKLPITANGYDIALTMLGIDPGKQAEYQEVTREEAGLRTMRELNSSNIVRHLETAWTRGDQGMFNTWMGEAQKWQVDHPGLVPPQASFGRELETHLRASAQAQGMGLPIGVTPRDVGARGMLRYGNIGTQ